MSSLRSVSEPDTGLSITISQSVTIKHHYIEIEIFS
jgi:hypothetical protein